jgi:hypothetical protein
MTYSQPDYITMAKRKQNITIVGRAANQRINNAIPRIRRELGYGREQATAVAIRMESVGQLSLGGKPETKRASQSGKLSMGAFAVSQLKRRREPKRTITRNVEPIVEKSVGQYARAYYASTPLMFTTKKKRTKKK